MLTEIEDRQVLPIIGPEVISVPGDGQAVPLNRYMAGELARRLDISGGNGNGNGVDTVVARYLEQPDADRDEVFFAVRQILTSQQWAAPEPLKKLAAIDKFDVFVSISYDSLLEKALDEVRFRASPRTRSLAYTLFSEPADLPAEYKPAYAANEAPPAEPMVYHICGKLNPSRDYAIWEEDFLRFGHRLQSRDFRPQNLFDLMRTRSLLMLGCGFPGWLARFFLAAAKGDALFSEGARGLVADSTCVSDPSLVLFLERRRTTVFSESATTFVDELHRRWMEAHLVVSPPPAVGGAAAAPAPAPAAPEPLPALEQDAIFISYASEDREQAILIRDALKNAGLDVWFDQRSLEPGDEFRDKIFANIEQCSFFLPVISRHTAAVGRRFFFLEWNKAADEVQFRSRDVPFIVPVVIDDTPPDAPHLPAPFRDRHWQRLEGPALPDTFLSVLRARIRDLRRARHSS
jgi:hypothetical protein